MIEFEVTPDLDNVSFAPTSIEQEVIQNVRTILRTRKGTVPLDRQFGLDWSFLDQPIGLAQATLSTEVIQQIRRYEPRAKVLRVNLSQSNEMEGQLKPRVVIGVIA